MLALPTHLTPWTAGSLCRALQAVHLVILEHRELAVLPHPGSKLGFLLLHSIRKLVAPALGAVERPVGLQGQPGQGG